MPGVVPAFFLQSQQSDKSLSWAEKGQECFAKGTSGAEKKHSVFFT
jgi:hypothetical protein